MKDFPLNDLLSATDVNKAKESLNQIFGHMNKKLKMSPYPISRALLLVEAISRDLNSQVMKILGGRRLMLLEYDEFEEVVKGALDVFKVWDDQLKKFIQVARDASQKRGERFQPIKVIIAATFVPPPSQRPLYIFQVSHLFFFFFFFLVTAVNAKTQDRLAYVRDFRKQHEQLLSTIVKVMRPVGKSAPSQGSAASISPENLLIQEVDEAYNSVRNIDVLDVTQGS
jgi:dynein heavy chain 1